MKFKDQLKKDLDIFINVDEFGELHHIDDMEMAVLVDSDGFQEFSNTKEIENIAEGIFQSTITIYVKAKDYSKPDVGYRLKFDNRSYTVIDSMIADGLLKIILYDNES